MCVFQLYSIIFTFLLSVLNRNKLGMGYIYIAYWSWTYLTTCYFKITQNLLDYQCFGNLHQNQVCFCFFAVPLCCYQDWFDCTRYLGSVWPGFKMTDLKKWWEFLRTFVKNIFYFGHVCFVLQSPSLPLWSIRPGEALKALDTIGNYSK